MAESSEEVLKLGRALIEDEALRQRFFDSPVDVLTEYGIDVAEKMTNEQLRELRLLDVIQEATSADRTALRSVSTSTAVTQTRTEAQVTIQIAVKASTFPASTPVVLVESGVAIATTAWPEDQ